MNDTMSAVKDAKAYSTHGRLDPKTFLSSCNMYFSNYNRLFFFGLTNVVKL